MLNHDKYRQVIIITASTPNKGYLIVQYISSFTELSFQCKLQLKYV
uniref:Uncharacterized protein n=1 Tax=Arundo donax TaxID=35708 RepID=A0A0A9ELQ1_ARUDO